MGTLDKTLQKIEAQLTRENEEQKRENNTDKEQNTYSIALRQINQCSNSHPENARVFALRGRINGKLKRFEEGERDFKKALALSKEKDPEILFQFGQLLNSNEQYREAIQYSSQCIHLSKGINAKAHNSLARSYCALKEHGKAMNHIELALKQDPNNALYYSNRALTRHNLSRKLPTSQEKITAYLLIVEDLRQAKTLEPQTKQYTDDYAEFESKLREMEKEYKSKLEVPLDLRLSPSVDSTPSPDSAPAPAVFLPAPRPRAEAKPGTKRSAPSQLAQQSQTKQTKRKSATPTFFADTQDATPTPFITSKRSKGSQAPSAEIVNPPSALSVPSVNNDNRDDLYHPWQSPGITPASVTPKSH